MWSWGSGGITVEIGDRVESELDQAYKRYSDYISRHYGWDPAPQAVWIRVNV
jgi:hypothetical protein